MGYYSHEIFDDENELPTIKVPVQMKLPDASAYGSIGLLEVRVGCTDDELAFALREFSMHNQITSDFDEYLRYVLPLYSRSWRCTVLKHFPCAILPGPF
jgi:hypothetical protein